MRLVALLAAAATLSANDTLATLAAGGLVLLTIPQLRGAEFLDQFRRHWEKKPLVPAPGQLIHWPPA